MPIKFLVLGAGVVGIVFGRGGGVEVPILFMGVGTFPILPCDHSIYTPARKYYQNDSE